MIVAVIPSREDSLTLKALELVLAADGVLTAMVDTRHRRKPAIYKWWNEGVAEAKLRGATHIAILNDDTVILPGTLPMMAGALDDPTIGVVYPNVNRRLDWGLADLGVEDTVGTFASGGMTGFAFMFRASDDLPEFDEGYHWWRGDDAFEEAVRARGLRVCRVVGTPVAHELTAGRHGATASKRTASLEPLIAGDLARWDTRWAPQTAPDVDPAIELVMIVKNEATTIERCLASVVAAGVTGATILDTGSTDGTQDIVRAYARAYGLNLHLVEEPFVNFGVARSRAFALARGAAGWLLTLDADMTVEIDPDFVPDPAVEAYMVDWGDGESFSYRNATLLRGDLPWESCGAVHEYTTLPTGPGNRVPTDQVRIVHHGEGRSSDGKNRWYIQLLEADLLGDPDNPRTVFYLADCYRFLGQPNLARPLYQRRAEMGGFEQERWYAQYRAALLEPEWPERLTALLAAWEARSMRLEPLYDVLRGLNERSQHHAVYRLTEGRAGPCTDDLFVHRSVWDWGMKFERSIAAWWVGQIAEARVLCEELLGNPRLPAAEREATERNLAICVKSLSAA